MQGGRGRGGPGGGRRRGGFLGEREDRGDRERLERAQRELILQEMESRGLLA